MSGDDLASISRTVSPWDVALYLSGGEIEENIARKRDIYISNQ
jgi:hypothetical protein